MQQYCYCPILKTRPSEVSAYELLDDSVKDGILPIIEMTGAIGYTYPKNYKIEGLRGERRAGDINDKIKKILSMVEKRRFVLDITDDASLMHDGLSSKSGGLLDPTDGYNAWLSFLQQDDAFRRQVIPTIQFNSMYRAEVEAQIKSLDDKFDYMAIKLPAFLSAQPPVTSIVFNNSIQKIINWIVQYLGENKLIVILDFGYISDMTKYQDMINKGLKDISDLSKLKALIPVSSSFPVFVSNAGKPPIALVENDVFHCVRTRLMNKDKIYCGDYALIHPIKYEMGSSGWIPRIDYVIRNEADKRPTHYDYARGGKRNTNAEYTKLAQVILNSKHYMPISELQVQGDIRIADKASGGVEGKSPSYWITVRSNIYMTMQYLYLKTQGSFLVL
jgi:hypothetical protein